MAEIEAFGEDLLRVLAPNPSPFTARGTNSWVLGRAEVAVIDPGPSAPGHLGALLRAIDGRRVGAILVTHAHLDHSALAPALSAAVGAPVLAFGDAFAGRRPAAGDLGPGIGVDEGFRPDVRLLDGEEVGGAGWRLRALHTPGHMGNHLCFDDGARLFSGDHAMGFATTLVSPPEGDMGDYVESLRRLLARGPRVLLPGHGVVVAEGARRLADLLDHRLAREAEVRAALARGPATARGIAAEVYAGLPAALLEAAERNVLAHLLDLARRGRATAPGGVAPDAAFRGV